MQDACCGESDREGAKSRQEGNLAKEERAPKASRRGSPLEKEDYQQASIDGTMRRCNSGEVSGHADRSRKLLWQTICALSLERPPRATNRCRWTWR